MSSRSRGIGLRGMGEGIQYGLGVGAKLILHLRFEVGRRDRAPSAECERLIGGVPEQHRRVVEPALLV